jgi:hypothetical protein
MNKMQDPPLTRLRFLGLKTGNAKCVTRPAAILDVHSVRNAEKIYVFLIGLTALSNCSNLDYALNEVSTTESSSLW